MARRKRKPKKPETDVAVDEAIRASDNPDGELEQDERGWRGFLAGLKKKRRHKHGDDHV